MSKQIDERVVEMTFDNKDFEKNVATSMSTIDKLKAALNFKGAEKGLNAINSAAKNVKLDGVSNAVDSVKVKFDALQVAGVTALANITNAALNTGKRMASAFTIDPIVQGFGEYETQLNSVQTIMANTASKGTTIDQVTDALNELNTYADKTIYNFTEMTRNIGTFTAAGVDLDKSVASIKGIANLAAMSGSSSTQAATAMYQLSQAIAAGRVSLMDWNSVVNAGMGGEQFQEALKRTARVMETGVDAAIEKYGSFRESLTQGQWLTTDVLTETLKQISGAYSEAELMQQGYTQEQARAIVEMSVTAEEAATKVKTFTQMIDTMKEAVGSGWAQTWQTVFGDFYEARDFWTSISDMFGGMIGSMSDARNTLLEGAFESSWEQIRGKIEATGGSLDLFDEKIREVVTEAGINYDDLISKTGDLSTAIQDGAINMEAVQEAFIRFVGSSGDVNKNLPEIEASFASFSSTVKDIWKYGFDDSSDKIEELTRAGYDYAEVSDLVQKITEGQELSVNDLTEAQLKAIGVTDEQLTSLGDLQEQLADSNSEFRALFDTLQQESGRVLFLDSIRNLLDAIIKPLKAVSEAWHNVFSIDSAGVYGILEAVNHFTESLIISDETAGNLTRTFEGLFSLLSIVTNFIGGGLSAAFQIIQTVLDHFDLGILDVTAGLGDMLTAFSDFVNSHNIFTAAIQVISNVIINAIIAIQDFINMVRESEIISVIAFNISKAFEGIKTAIEGIAGKGMELLGKFVDLIMSLSEMSFDEIIQAFRDFGSEVFNYLVTSFSEIAAPIQTAISNIASFANEKFGWLIDILIRVKDTVVDVVSTIIERFSGTGLAGIFAIVFGAGVLKIISKFLDAITSLRSPMDALTGLLDGLKDSFADFAKAKSFQAMSVGVRNIAIAVAILAASVYALAQVPVDQLVPAAGAIVAISIALAGVTAALGYFAKGDASIKLGGSIAAIGAGVLMIASAFAVLNGIDTDSLIQSGAAIVSIMVVLAGLSIAMQKFGGKGTAQEFGGPALQIIALAAAVRIVADAVKQMSEIDQGSMTTAIFGMITVFGALTVLMGVMNKFGGGLSNASGLLVMVIGLQAFLLVVGQLANFDASGIIANLPNILVLFGMIAALMAASSLAGANSAKGGAALILISAAMLIMTQVIQIIGNMDEGVISRGMSAITGIGLIFTMLIAVTNLAGNNAVKAGASLLIMSAAIIVLTGAIALLGSMDESTLAKGTAVVAAISAMFAGLIAVTHFAGDASKTIIKLTIAIGALVAMVVLLSFLDPAKVVPATACITALMVAFGAMTALTKFAGKANSGMAVALGVIIVLAGVVAVLGGLPMDGAIQASISIGILMTAMSAALVAMGYAGNVSTTAMAAMGILTGVVAALAVILGALTALDVAPSIETSASISIMLLGMTAVLAALSAIGPTANLALSALGPLLAVIGVLGAVFTALGGLNNLLGGGISDAIAGAIPIMENIGKALGSFVGGIVGGIASGAMSALPEIAKSINAFWLGIQPFILGVKVMGPDALNGVKTLVEMLAMITGANLLESLGQFFGAGNSMDQFAANLKKFGEAISEFSTTLAEGNFNGETVTAAANAGKALAEMQNAMQGSGGRFQMFEGTKDMGAFGKQLKEFGKAIVEFSEAVSADGAINSDAIQNAANAGKVMAELQKSLVQNGDGFSVVKFFAGEQNLSNFGTQIKSFGEAMVEFSKTVSEDGAIDSAAVENAANAGKIMTELQKSIGTNTTSVFSLFAGEQNLEHFGTQIKKFGEGIVSFSNVITENGGIDTEAITKAKDAGTAMSELANSLPTYALGSGKLDLTGFGYDLTDYAGSISRMSQTLATVDMSKINQATNVAKTISNTLTSLQGIDESVINKFWVLESLGTYLSDFAADVANLDTTSISLAATAAQRIADLINSMTGMDASSVYGFTEAISALGSVSYDQIYASFNSVDFSLIGVNVMTRLSQGIEIGAQNVEAKLNIVLQSLSQFATTGAQDWNMSGLRLATEFATGIQNGAQNVQAQVSIMVQNAADALNGYEGFFYAAGSNLAVGFANGINASAYRARAAAAAMANAAKQAAEAALQEHSPSKVMQRIGEFAGAGFVIGIENYIDASADVGGTMAEAAISAASKAAEIFSNFGDLDSMVTGLRDLSEALDTSKKDEKKNSKETEEATENQSKLSEALSSVADSVDDLIERRNDLKSINELLSRTGVSFSEGFISELMSSDGQYAGALDEMVNLTDEQLQSLNDIYDNAEAAESMDAMFQTMSESIDNLNKRRKNLKAMSTLLKKTGVTFSDKFVKEIMSSSGDYADSLYTMTDLTDEELQKIADIYEENALLDQIQTVIDALVEDDGLADAFTYSGKSIQSFVEDVNDFGISIDDAIDKMSEFADSVSDGFSTLELEGQTTLEEFTQNLENNWMVAKEWEANVNKVFSQISWSPLAEDFRKEVLEGGFDQWGQIMADLANSSQEEIYGFLQLWDYMRREGVKISSNVSNSLISGDFAKSGTRIAQGVAKGVENGIPNVTSAATLMCTNTEDTVKNYFGIHSPSTLMYQIGEYMVQGLVNGIVASSTELDKAFTLVNKAIDLLQQLGDEGIDIQVRVTPVIDTTDFATKLASAQASAGVNTGSLLSNATLNTIDRVASHFGQNGVRNSNSELVGAVSKLSDKIDSIDPSNFGVTYQQNNYSPKALNTGEIYRKTKSYISRYRSKNTNGGNLLR